MNASHDHIELAEQILALIEGAILEDVDLDAGQDPERSEFSVQLADELQLLLQPFRRQSVRHCQPR